MMRAAAAAAGGHAGAQLAVMGEGAVGARVVVWWPIDGKWFNGVVSSNSGGEGLGLLVTSVCFGATSCAAIEEPTSSGVCDPEPRFELSRGPPAHAKPLNDVITP